MAGVFLLAVQVLSLGHLLVVHHVTCPEHGEVIHTSHGAATPPGGANPGAARAVEHSIVASEPSKATDHDHCLACVEANRRALLSGPDQTFAHQPFVISVVHATETAFTAPIDLILLSPKGSPPLI